MKRFLCLLLFLILSEASYAEQVPQQVSTNGRYVIIMNSIVRADQYLLDTKTGKVWQKTVDNNGDIYWKATRYDNSDGTTKFIPQ